VHQIGAPTPNFGNKDNANSVNPDDDKPCTQSFVSVVVDPPNFTNIIDPKVNVFDYWNAQSWLVTGVNIWAYNKEPTCTNML